MSQFQKSTKLQFNGVGFIAFCHNTFWGGRKLQISLKCIFLGKMTGKDAKVTICYMFITYSETRFT